MRLLIVAIVATLYFSLVNGHTMMTGIVINGQTATNCMRPVYPGSLYSSTGIGADFPISSSNLFSNGVTSGNYTCGFLPYAGQPAAAKCAVTAGSTIGVTYYHGGNYGSESPIYDKCIASSHKGPWMAFLAKSDSGSGNVWFKIAQVGQINSYTGSDYNGVKWASPDRMLENDCTMYFEVPSDIAPGNYLLRTEILAMHDAGTHGIQPYVHCTELTISGSGYAQPSGVSIPGNWDYSHPGMTYNIYNNYKTAYPFPGPAVYVAGASATVATTAAATSAAATTAAATVGTATTGTYSSTTGTFQRINVKVTIKIKLAPSAIDINYLVYEITEVLGIPSSALSDVTIDLDKSTATTTTIQFTIWNELKIDGTRVNPVAAALQLQTMATSNDPRLASTSYLAGMQVIDSETQEDSTTASDAARNSVIIGAAVVAAAALL